MRTLEPTSAIFVASLAILGSAGIAKLFKPDDTARALRIAGLPAGRGLVRIGAAAEITVAIVALAIPGPLTGALVGASYGAFAGFVALALLRGWPLASCGCFGRPDTQPGLSHLALDLGATAFAIWWALEPPRSIADLVSGQPWSGVALILVSAVVAGLAYLIWTKPSPGTV